MKNLFAFVLLALLAFGCTQYNNNPPNPPPNPGQGQNSTIAATASVSIQNFAFSPSTVQVSAGTTVTWANMDSMVHTATSDSGAFDTGTIEGGSSSSYTFSTPGTYTYHCSVHPSMKGTVIVK